MRASALCTGNPLRREFVDFPDRDYWQKEKRNFRILVVGGSQGAKVLNDVIPVAVKKLQDVDIKHQTGMASMELVSQKYQNAGLNADVFEFIQDMASAYSWADMVICRAGAMTVSEIAAAGLPSVLVPLPHAIDDHQRANARYLADEGAAILIEQNELNETSLINAIEQIQHNLESMSRLARSKARLDATDRVAEVCIVEADV
jgi:UDP-N-acetylglucosamine--N-acetylmuramyl-(pentapeptide) pyrophosphoryl-undecaprenol N-acetylglucosamine transferase